MKKSYKLNAALKISVLAILNLIIFNLQSGYAQLFWNQACTFAGSSSSYIALRNSATLNITGSFSIEAWVNPTSVSGFSKGIVAKGGALGTSLEYAIRVVPGGRFTVYTNGAGRLTSKTTTILPLNQWSHIAATYNSATNAFAIYFNGSLDTSSVVAGAAPPSNSDSLFIGISGNSTPFSGSLDEIRIWNRAISSTEVSINRRNSLGTGTGPYLGLILSIPFQQNEATGITFTVFDFSGTGNVAFTRGVTALDQSNRPLSTIQINDCVELDGADDYLAGPDDPSVSPTAQLTMSAWIFPKSSGNGVLIHKGPGGGGAGTNYRLRYAGGTLNAAVNDNFGFTTSNVIPINQWSHVAFTYYALLGTYQFFLNGALIEAGTNNVGNITNGTDSIYIGGSNDLVCFDGYMDEVRIIPDVKFEEAINSFMFKSIELSNGGVGNYAVYSFDGYLYDGSDTGPLLHFKGDADFAHCGSINNQPQSPQNRADASNFQDGFQLKKSFQRVPPTGTTGSFSDSLNILLDEVITDINVFIALNHTAEGDLEIHLFAPNGDDIILYNNNSLTGNSDNLITVFDDQADSSLLNGRYVNFSPRIKPLNNLNSVFSGDSTKGKWRLLIRDELFVDTGVVYCWGIQFNNTVLKPHILDAHALVQGFYNAGTNSLIQDTMNFIFRNTESPYGIYDEVKVYLKPDGFAQVISPLVFSGVGYFLHLEHRNSIETWSGGAVYYDALSWQAEYDFRTSPAQAFGNNMIQVDNSPVRFAIYGGDVNQDGVVDGTDIGIIENDAFNFLSGYVVSDVNGDNFVDATDGAIADNNSYNFVAKVIPAAPRPFVINTPEEKINITTVTGEPDISTQNSNPVKERRNREIIIEEKK